MTASDFTYTIDVLIERIDSRGKAEIVGVACGPTSAQRLGEIEHDSWFKMPEPSTAKPALVGLSHVSDMGHRPSWQR